MDEAWKEETLKYVMEQNVMEQNVIEQNGSAMMPNSRGNLNASTIGDNVKLSQISQ